MKRIRKKAWKEVIVSGGVAGKPRVTFFPPSESFVVAMARMSNLGVVREELIVYLVEGAEYSSKCCFGGKPFTHGVKFEGCDYKLEDAIEKGLAKVEGTNKVKSVTALGEKKFGRS